MQKSYAQILKASALIGGSSLVVVAIGIVRTKIMALLLGTAGFGLMGVYSSIVDLAVAIAGLGINSSGVRQIAEATCSGDEQRIARTATVLRRTAVVFGVIGGGALALLSRQVSVFTFGDEKHAWAIVLLSLAVAFRLIAGGQGALIQGMRRIGDLAKLGMLGALLGTVASIPIVYALGTEGIAPSLVCFAIVSMLTSWLYARRVAIDRPALTLPEVRSEASVLVKIGLAFMASAFLTMAAAYGVRMLLVRQVGLEAAGLYSAAWTLGGLYVNFVLQAMGADFYPRLIGVANDDAACNRLTNEQAQVSMLAATPGVCATVVFAPFVIALFYSAQFTAAVETLRWVCLGVALRVITWPMGFIIVAKGRQWLFLFADCSWAVINIALTWLAVQKFGVEGAGIAFFISYFCHGLIVYPIVHVLSGFRLSIMSLRIGTFFLVTTATAFATNVLLPAPWAVTLGIAIILGSGVYSAHTLVVSLAEEGLSARVQKLLEWLRIRRWY